jgi:hypothetical protein
LGVYELESEGISASTSVALGASTRIDIVSTIAALIVNSIATAEFGFPRLFNSVYDGGQCLHAPHRRRQHQRGVAIVVLGANIGTGLQQCLHAQLAQINVHCTRSPIVRIWPHPPPFRTSRSSSSASSTTSTSSSSSTTGINERIIPAHPPPSTVAA